jgi:hypothetical protein
MLFLIRETLIVKWGSGNKSVMGGAKTEVKDKKTK